METITERQALVKLAAYCSKAERCKYDILKKLDSWGISDATIISNIIKALTSEKYLDENRFCRFFINDKINFNKWGKNKLYYELKRRNIPDSIISEYLNDTLNEKYENQLIQLLKSKRKTIKDTNGASVKIKLIRFALARGYTYELIKKCLPKINEPSE